MKDISLVQLLSDGAFHSGEELGSALGISRAAVWKRLQTLSAYGLHLERVRGQGYRLPGGLSLLDPDELSRLLGEDAGRVALDVRTLTDSTNSDALEYLRNGLTGPAVVLAEYQSAGRGRRGRQWQSPFASSLYLSLACRFPLGASELEGLSLAVGVAVADALGELGVGGVSLKWPNDVIIAGHKLGGVLIELTGDLDSGCSAVLGIGINGALPPAVAIDQPATDLFRETGVRPDRNLLAATLIRHLLDMLDRFARGGFSVFLPCWQQRDAFADSEVVVYQGDTAISGVARGVTARGALRLETPEGIREFHGGEVSLRTR